MQQEQSMSNAQTLNHTINKTSFRTAIVLIMAGAMSVFFPLDSPEGLFADRMLWYSANVDSYVMGWVIQMIAMLTLSGVFACEAWQTHESHPFSSFIAGIALLIATVAFIIPKFIAIWSIPQMVTASSTVSANAAVAEQLFRLLNPTLPYSLFTSFDYLGFWMYGIYGLLIARPLFSLMLSAKVAGACLGLYGLLYHVLFVGVICGGIETAKIALWAESLSVLLLIPVISMAVYFRMLLKADTGERTQ